MESHRLTSLAAPCFLGFFLCLWLISPTNVLAQAEITRSLSLQIKEWQKTLDDAEKDISKPEIPDSRLADWRDRLAALSLAARTASNSALPEARTVRSDIAALGPPPAEGLPPEAPNIASQRKDLTGRLVAVEGTAKEADLVVARADRLLAVVNALRRVRLTEHILARGVSPLSTPIWLKALPELGSALETLYAGVKDRLSFALVADITRQLALGVGLAVLLAFPLRSWLIRKFGYIQVQGEPTYMQRLWAASFTGVVRALLPSVAAMAVYLSLAYGDFLGDPMAAVFGVALASLVCLFFVVGFARSALAPYEPDWRMVPIHNEGARSVSRSITGLAVLFALDRVASELCNQYDASVELVSIQKFVFGVLISLELSTLLRRRAWYADPRDEPAHWWRQPRCWLALPVAAIPLSAVLGYVVLSRLLATQLVLTAGLYVSIVVLRGIATEFAAYALSAVSPLGARLRAGLALNDEGAEMLAFWLAGLARFLLLVLGCLLLLPLWGVAGKDLSGWLASAFFGFKVGNITVSLADMLVALLSFAGLLIATRILQKSLDQRIFPKTRLDVGLRHSIRSGIGYAGFAVALMFAVSTLGLNLSNIAIIAGALSVGIGLGLQNIVNNFVSGLILLVERPIKAGDWVAVGEFQGYVRRISVRATEISTFDRASVFIPNSSLISGTVMNRTYADKTGRVVLPIGLAYHADPKRARQVLLDIASAHPDIRENPPPNVFFQGFGDSSLNLELVAILNDVDQVRSVTSDLCFAIHEAFRREGIEIPFPQRDIKISVDEEQLRRVLG